MLNIILRILLKFLNLSPLFSVSCDELFGDIDTCASKRYSLLRLSVGSIKLYFITIQSGSFNFIKTLNINKLRPWPSKEETERKLNVYEQFISNKRDDEISIQTQYLEQKITIENNAKTSFQNKISAYNAISIVTASYIIYIFSKMLSEWQFNFKYFTLMSLIILAIAAFTNCLLFTYLFLKNRTICRSTFSDLKNNPTIKKLSSSYYFDWYNLKSERDILSSYVKNIEKYIVNSVVLVLTFSLVHSAYDIFSHSSKLSSNSNMPPISITLIDDNGNFIDDKLIPLASVLENISKNEIQTLYIVKSNLSRNEEKYQQIIDIVVDIIDGSRNEL